MTEASSRHYISNDLHISRIIAYLMYKRIIIYLIWRYAIISHLNALKSNVKILYGKIKI